MSTTDPLQDLDDIASSERNDSRWTQEEICDEPCKLITLENGVWIEDVLRVRDSMMIIDLVSQGDLGEQLVELKYGTSV